MIRHEGFRASVLHLYENQTVLRSIAANRCLLTTSSFLPRPEASLSRAARTLFRKVYGSGHHRDNYADREVDGIQEG
jgi:hypothetical protein